MFTAIYLLQLTLFYCTFFSPGYHAIKMCTVIYFISLIFQSFPLQYVFRSLSYQVYSYSSYSIISILTVRILIFTALLLDWWKFSCQVTSLQFLLQLSLNWCYVISHHCHLFMLLPLCTVFYHTALSALQIAPWGRIEFFEFNWIELFIIHALFHDNLTHSHISAQIFVLIGRAYSTSFFNAL